MLRAAGFVRRSGPSALRYVSNLAGEKRVELPIPPKLRFYDGGQLTTTSTCYDRSSASVAAQTVWGMRQAAARLRKCGKIEEALHLLETGGARESKNVADLIEYFMTLRDYKFRTSRLMFQRFRQIFHDSPARKVTMLRNLLLSVYVKAAAGRTTADVSLFRREVATEAVELWNRMTEKHTPMDVAADAWTLSIMYKLLGECRAADLIKAVEERADDFGIIPSFDALCQRILCLGMCGMSAEAEREFFSDRMESYRLEPAMIQSMVRAHLVSNRISKAEGLISVHGSAALDLKCCNDYFRACRKLRLPEKAENMIGKMQKWEQTKYPQPNAESYNLFIKTLCRNHSIEASTVAMDRALLVVEEMRRRKIIPSKGTYNTLIRSLVTQGKFKEAFSLYKVMAEPSENTFNILMIGADIDAANELIEAMLQRNIQPKYGLLKALVRLYARSFGTDAAFEFAKDLVKKFGNIIEFNRGGGQEAVRMALIHACGSVGDLSKAFSALLVKLSDSDAESGRLAPLYTATCVMQACFKNGAVGKGMELFLSMKEAGLKLNFEVYESAIRGLIVASERGDEPHPEFLDSALVLMKEMHDSGAARSSRKAAYLYNSMISAIARQGDLFLAYQIFAKMVVHTNLGAIYFARKQTPFNDQTEGILENNYSFPLANTATYNSMIYALGLTNYPEEAFEIYDTLLNDPYNEPNDSTFSILAEIATGYDGEVMFQRAQALLKAVDTIPIPTAELERRRTELRVFLLQRSSLGHTFQNPPQDIESDDYQSENRSRSSISQKVGSMSPSREHHGDGMKELHGNDDI